MSVDEIKSSLASLSPIEQTEVAAFLFQLRHAADSEYQGRVDARLADKDPAHWLTPNSSSVTSARNNLLVPGDEVFLHIGLLEAMPKGGAPRRAIIDFLFVTCGNTRTLPATSPTKTPRYSERQIKLIGDYAVTYWLDEPVKTVMVVDLRPADK